MCDDGADGASCFICNVDLNAMELGQRNRHINNCLDGLEAPHVGEADTVNVQALPHISPTDITRLVESLDSDDDDITSSSTLQPDPILSNVSSSRLSPAALSPLLRPTTPLAPDISSSKCLSPEEAFSPPELMSRSANQCWICHVKLTTSEDFAGHLSRCSSLPEDLCRRMLDGDNGVVYPAILSVIDNELSNLQRLRKAILAIYEPSSRRSRKVLPCQRIRPNLSPALQPLQTATTEICNGVVATRAKRDSGESDPNHDGALGRWPRIGNISAAPPSIMDATLSRTVEESPSDQENQKGENSAIPPCPNYQSMTIPELKKIMSNYGFRSGSKTYMVRELTDIWATIHRPQEPAPTLPAMDPFRSPPNPRRRRKADFAASNPPVNSIFSFIAKHDLLLEHILCLQSVDVNELHFELKRAEITVPLREVIRFCREQGINTVDKYRQATNTS
uniref:Structure-specific endonuclease subunit SLX4 n=1 Tax=Spongospora subterranea TaxID=70186 RepID=A0A0H5QGR3_9EUKA|eukprot:CRZ01165.1 hypothetical protein [Spongospora subterranea]